MVLDRLYTVDVMESHQKQNRKQRYEDDKQRYFETREMFPLFGNSRTLCCNQAMTTLTFKSQLTLVGKTVYY